MNANEYPPGLSAKENNALILEYQRTHSEEIKNKLILGNMRLASHYIKLHGEPFLGSVCLGYPSYEDLNQIAIFEIIECIEKFDTTRGISFSSYFTKALRNRFLETSRAGKHSRKDIHYDDYISDETEHHTYLDDIEDKSITPEKFVGKVEFSFFKSKILPYLGFREQFVIWQYFVNHKTQSEISEMINVHRSQISKILRIAVQKINEFYNNGIDEVSKQLHGVELSLASLNRFNSSHQFLKRHGEGFLRDTFLPTLSAKDKLIFQNSILYYAGQTYEQLSEDSGLPITNLMNNIKRFEMMASQLEHKTKQNPEQYKIDKIKNTMLKYGGAPFLAKYFLPTLEIEKRRAFIYGIMQFKGQIGNETASFAGQTLPRFKENLALSVDQLKKTDFKKIVMQDITNGCEQE